MLCLRYRRLLVPYIECELDERVRAKVEAHMSRCERCAAEVELIRSVSGAIKSFEVPAMEPAPDLWAKVSARIEREVARPARRPWVRITQAVTACAAAVFVGVVGMSLLNMNAPTESRLPPEAKKPAAGVEDRTPGSKGVDVPTAVVAAAPSRMPAPVESPPVVSGGRIAPAPRVRVYVPRRQPVVERLAAAPPVTVRSVPGESVETVRRDPAAPLAEDARERFSESGIVVAKHGETGRLRRGVPAAPSMGLSPASPGRPFVGDTASAEETATYGADLAAREVMAAVGAEGESVVDALNETEGVRIAALFTYP